MKMDLQHALYLEFWEQSKFYSMILKLFLK